MGRVVLLPILLLCTELAGHVEAAQPLPTSMPTDETESIAYASQQYTGTIPTQFGLLVKASAGRPTAPRCYSYRRAATAPPPHRLAASPPIQPPRRPAGRPTTSTPHVLLARRRHTQPRTK